MVIGLLKIEKRYLIFIILFIFGMAASVYSALYYVINPTVFISEKVGWLLFRDTMFVHRFIFLYDIIAIGILIGVRNSKHIVKIGLGLLIGEFLLSYIVP